MQNQGSFERSSIKIMISQFYMSIFGFLFWIIVGNYFSPQDLGFFITLFSELTLISTFALLGLDQFLLQIHSLKFSKSIILTTCFILSFSSAFFLFIIYFIIKINENYFWFSSNIVFFFIITILLQFSILFPRLFDNVIVAYSKEGKLIAKNIIQTSFRLFLIIAFITISFTSKEALIIVFLVSLSISNIYLIIFIKNLNLLNRSRSLLSGFLIRNYFSFLTVNYLSFTLSSISPLILIIWTEISFGEQNVGLIYIPWILTNLIITIPNSIAFSQISRTSISPNNFSSYFFRANVLFFLLIIPIILGLFILGELFLSFFGAFYIEGFSHLMIFSLGSFFYGTNTFVTSILKSIKKNSLLLGFNLINFLVFVFLLFIFTNEFDMIGISLSWSMTQIISFILGLIIFTFVYKKRLEISRRTNLTNKN